MLIPPDDLSGGFFLLRPVRVVPIVAAHGDKKRVFPACRQVTMRLVQLV
jgi:hypothetical protein